MPDPTIRTAPRPLVAPAADVLALPDGNAARGIMVAAVAGIAAWGAIGAGVLSLWRLMA